METQVMLERANLLLQQSRFKDAEATSARRWNKTLETIMHFPCFRVATLTRVS